MIGTEAGTWSQLNHRYLAAALDDLRTRIDAESSGESESSRLLGPLRDQMAVPPAIETIRDMFGLSAFERDVLLLCSGVELDASFAATVARLCGRETVSAPTFGLAMAVLDSPHWSALTPAGPLRHWRLIEVTGACLLTTAPLQVPERVLHFLTGCGYLDEQFTGLVELLEPGGLIVDSHRRLSESIAQTWIEHREDDPPPVIQIMTSSRDSAFGVATDAIGRFGFQAASIRAEDIPGDARQREELARLWERESVLGSRILIVDCTGRDDPTPGANPVAERFVERISSPVITVSRQPMSVRRPSAKFEVGILDQIERESIWRDSLSDERFNLNGTAARLAEQFHLSAASIREISRNIPRNIDSADESKLPELIWGLCREQTRPRLDQLAQRIEPVAGWNDIVLPAPQRQILSEIAMHLRHRTRVYADWGFGSKGLRGLGISALFSGPSGTGKTMAAEVLARELNLDLYRIDLSQVVSKYIGETEKNLARLFDAAEGCGVILLFDEADALFGKRSEVRDSHDRYANIEVSYLLQRMETYGGLAVLTTNLRSALDQAFLRRIRFAVHFPFPDATTRAEIWRRVFPDGTPLDGVDVEKLSRLGLAGGNIRNIALSAAFLAADSSEAVGMRHLLQAARSEANKLERPLSDSEIRGWVE